MTAPRAARTIRPVDDDRQSSEGGVRDLALLLSLALVFRTFMLRAFPNVIDTADAVHYLETARYFANGEFFSINPKIPVLYPALGALIHLVVADLERACILASLISATLLVIPVYGLARDLHGRSAACVVALMVAVWPWLADYGCRVAPDALGCTLWFTSLWCFARAMRRGKWWTLLAALAFGGLHLARPEGTVLWAASAGMALILYVGDDSGKLRRYIPFAVCSAVLLALYSLYMRQLTGEATVNVRAGVILTDLEIAPMIRTAMRAAFEVLPIMLGPLAIVFFGPGLFVTDPGTSMAAARSRDLRLELCVFALCGIQWSLSAFVLSAEPRYLMSVVVACSLWTARGIVIVGHWARPLPWGRWLRWAPVACMLGLMLTGVTVDLARQHITKRPSEPLEYRQVGRWMGQHLEPGLILTRKPQIGYYAGMQTTGPHELDSLEQAIVRAKAAGAAYMVIDERYTAAMIPGVAPLLDPKNAPADLLPVKLFDLYPGCRVMVYQVVGGEGNADGASAPVQPSP